ncbi:MAG: DegV family protein [Bacilli bacterium]|jgi:DegV family protein with EDD domain|nr:DegV family protein [Acholeplasmataceae bacterium]
MKNYLIFTDSTADLPMEYFQLPMLKIIPLSFMIDGKQYIDGDLDTKEFYDKLRAGGTSTTSQLNPEQYLSIIEPHVRDGKDILVIAFSSGLSGTANSMRIALEELQEQYPERKIFGVDSLCASLGEGLLVHLAVEAYNAGKSIAENFQMLEDTKLKICHWFTVEDLHHLRRGGRLSGFSAFIGSVLKVKPVLHLNDEGKLIPRKKTIGRKKSIEKLFEQMEKTIINPEEQVIFISHGDCLDDANYLKNLILEKYKVKDVVINGIGTVIGSHSGPGTLALFYLGASR